jgi:4-diphosphocytidyl-2-C-methyl-D-erythritol kinase
VLVHPGVAVATADVFKAPELTRDSPAITIRGFLASGGRNDCEPVVRQRFPVVAEALDWLGQWAPGAPARLTGTGACVYAAVVDERAAHDVLGRLPTRWTGWAVRGVNRSPLAARLEAERA